MKKTLIQVGLWILIALFAYLCVMSIMRPIEFRKVKKQRYEKVIQKLKDIRTAQNAYKDEFNTYIASFDTLIDFIKNDSIKYLRAIGSLTDDQLEAGMTEAQAVKRGLIIRDTIKVSALDTLFGKNYPIDELRYVPFTKNNKEFKMAKGVVKTMSGVKIQVFEAKVSTTNIFYGVYDEYREEILEFNGERIRINKYPGLSVGSVTEATNNAGNWE